MILLKKAELLLCNFLWTDDDDPLEMNNNISAPEILDEFHNYIKSETDDIEYSRFNIEVHPTYLKYEYKLFEIFFYICYK